MELRRVVFFSLVLGVLASHTNGTVVQTVDQPVTTRAGTWTHMVAEAGDYQIGMAWLEVKPKAQVDLHVRAGGKEIKSLSARPGLAPLRFERDLRSRCCRHLATRWAS